MIDLSYARVLLPAEKTELAQLEKWVPGATFALCSEDLAPAYPMLVRYLTVSDSTQLILVWAPQYPAQERLEDW